MSVGLPRRPDRDRFQESLNGKMSQGERNANIELIKEKMKEKRRKKALGDTNTSWSRSFSKRKGTSASILKASLRSNNQSLAKALASSRHETQQAHRSIVELQRDRQFLLQEANATRQAEKECLKRFGKIKQVLTNVTTSLCDAVNSLGQALDLCSVLPIRDSSLGIVPRISLTSDDDSFRIGPNADHGPSNCNRQANLEMEFPSLDDVDISLRFADEPSDSKDVNSCGKRRESHLLQPPAKNSRNAGYLDPVAMQEALAGDEDKEEDHASSTTKVQSTSEAAPLPEKRETGKLRRATFNVTPGKSEEPKERYVFVHSPPGQYSSYTTQDMEMTGGTSNAQDEHNDSMAPKSQYSHDEQAIRPWGNLHTDKPKILTKTKPPTNVAKSELPKPQKKELSKTDKECEGVNKACPAKKSKNTKNASKKSKKITFMLDSAKNDLGVFDLSAGESFTVPPPIFKEMKSKPTDSLSGFAKDAQKGQEDIACVIDLTCQAENEQTEKVVRIKRRSKKARSVVTPNIDKAAVVGRGAKLSAKEVVCDLVADDVLDGTYLGAQPPMPDKAQPASSGRVAEDKAEDVVEILGSAKPSQKHHSSKEKRKRKNAKPPSTKSAKDDMGTEVISQTDPMPHSLKNPSTKTDKPSGIPVAKHHACDVIPPPSIRGDVANDLGTKKSHHPGKSRGPPREPVCRGSSPSPSVSIKPISSTSKDSETGCSPAASAADVNCRHASGEEDARGGGPSHQSRRGHKRRADALEEEALGTEKEAVSDDTGRCKRRGVTVNYKEPSLHSKLRRDVSPMKAKKKTNKFKRTSLGTVTNVL